MMTLLYFYSFKSLILLMTSENSVIFILYDRWFYNRDVLFVVLQNRFYCDFFNVLQDRFNNRALSVFEIYKTI